MLRAAGIAGGYREFNECCVRQRRGLPAAAFALGEQNSPVKIFIC